MAKNLAQIFATSPLTTFQSGDLFYVVRGSGDYATTYADLLTAFGGAGGAAWGDITGTLSDQTDLQTALDGKQPINTVTAANEASDTNCFPLFVTAATGALGPKTNAGLAFNSASGVLTATGLNADTLVVTGDVEFPVTIQIGGFNVTAFASTVIPCATQNITFSGPTAARTYTLPNSDATLIDTNSAQTLLSKTFVAPALGAATGTSLALGGATIGSHALAVTGTANVSGNLFSGGNVQGALFQSTAGSLKLYTVGGSLLADFDNPTNIYNRTIFSNAVVTTPQALSGAGAVNVTTSATAFTSTGGAQALTLADGTNGQIKTIAHVSDGGSGVLTPTTKSGYTTITFTNVGDSVTLQFFTGAGWCIVGIFGAVAA